MAFIASTNQLQQKRDPEGINRMKTLESITACFDKLTAKNHPHLVQKKSTFESAFASLRVLIALLLCAAAAFLMVSGTVLAVSRPQTPAKVSKGTLTFADRVF